MSAKQIKTDKYPNRWKKGESGNPNGRPHAPETEELRQALHLAKKKHGDSSILEHFVERAYENDQVLIALIKKLLPDKVSSELKIEGLENLAEDIKQARMRVKNAK